MSAFLFTALLLVVEGLANAGDTRTSTNNQTLEIPVHQSQKNKLNGLAFTTGEDVDIEQLRQSVGHLVHSLPDYRQISRNDEVIRACRSSTAQGTIVVDLSSVVADVTPLCGHLIELIGHIVVDNKNEISAESASREAILTSSVLSSADSVKEQQQQQDVGKFARQWATTFAKIVQTHEHCGTATTTTADTDVSPLGNSKIVALEQGNTQDDTTVIIQTTTELSAGSSSGSTQTTPLHQQQATSDVVGLVINKDEKSSSVGATTTGQREPTDGSNSKLAKSKINSLEQLSAAYDQIQREKEAPRTSHSNPKNNVKAVHNEEEIDEWIQDTDHLANREQIVVEDTKLDGKSMAGLSAMYDALTAKPTRKYSQRVEADADHIDIDEWIQGTTARYEEKPLPKVQVEETVAVVKEEVIEQPIVIPDDQFDRLNKSMKDLSALYDERKGQQDKHQKPTTVTDEEMEIWIDAKMRSEAEVGLSAEELAHLRRTEEKIKNTVRSTMTLAELSKLWDEAHSHHRAVGYHEMDEWFDGKGDARHATDKSLNVRPVDQPTGDVEVVVQVGTEAATTVTLKDAKKVQQKQVKKAKKKLPDFAKFATETTEGDSEEESVEPGDNNSNKTATPTSTPTDTITLTTVPTHTATYSPTETVYPTNTAIPTGTPIPTYSYTQTTRVTLTNTLTNIPTHTSTASIIPTYTQTGTAVPTHTQTQTATGTVYPTSTAMPTSTPIPTYTTTSTATVTYSNTLTPIPTHTGTESAIPTHTLTGTVTSTTIPTYTATDTAVPTHTATLTHLPTGTATGTTVPTYTSTVTTAPTGTLTASVVPTHTATDTMVPTRTLTITVVPSHTSTATPLPTRSDTLTDIPTHSSTVTSLPTGSPTSTVVPTRSGTATVVPTSTPTDTTVPTGTQTGTSIPTYTSTSTTVPTHTATPERLGLSADCSTKLPVQVIGVSYPGVGVADNEIWLVVVNRLDKGVVIVITDEKWSKSIGFLANQKDGVMEWELTEILWPGTVVRFWNPTTQNDGWQVSSGSLTLSGDRWPALNGQDTLFAYWTANRRPTPGKEDDFIFAWTNQNWCSAIPCLTTQSMIPVSFADTLPGYHMSGTRATSVNTIRYVPSNSATYTPVQRLVDIHSRAWDQSNTLLKDQWSDGYQILTSDCDESNSQCLADNFYFMFTGISTPGEDQSTSEFWIVSVKDIPKDSVFYFADEGWSPTRGGFEELTGDGVLKWTVGEQPVSSGATVRFYMDGSWKTTHGSVETEGNAIALGEKDQLFAYTGTRASPTFIAAIATTDWCSGGCLPKSTISELPEYFQHKPYSYKVISNIASHKSSRWNGVIDKDGHELPTGFLRKLWDDDWESSSSALLTDLVPIQTSIDDVPLRSCELPLTACPEITVMIIGMQAPKDTSDHESAFWFVTTLPIEANSVITFTDRGWYSSSDGFYDTPNDGYFEWTATANVEAGSVVEARRASDGTWSTSVGTVTSDDPPYLYGEDQLFAWSGDKGAAPTTSTGQEAFIFAFSNTNWCTADVDCPGLGPPRQVSSELPDYFNGQPEYQVLRVQRVDANQVGYRYAHWEREKEQPLQAMVLLRRLSLSSYWSQQQAKYDSTEVSRYFGNFNIEECIVFTTDTPTATQTSTVIPTRSRSPTSTATATTVPTQTDTVTRTTTNTRTSTSTPVPTHTTSRTTTPTNTQLPTHTLTSTTVPTHTTTITTVPTGSATLSVIPTATSIPTHTGTATSIPTHTLTSTGTATETSIPTHTLTKTPTASLTNVPTHTVTNTRSSTATAMPTHTLTSTTVPTHTVTRTTTSTQTRTLSPTRTLTAVPTHTLTATASATATPTPTSTTTTTGTPIPPDAKLLQPTAVMAIYDSSITPEGLSITTTFSACTAVTFDATHSTSLHHAQFSRVEWTIEYVEGAAVPQDRLINIVEITKLLTNVNTRTTVKGVKANWAVNVPASLLLPASKYRISVRLRDAYGITTDTQVITIRDQNDQAPLVSFANVPATMTRDEWIDLRIAVQTPQCTNAACSASTCACPSKLTCPASTCFWDGKCSKDRCSASACSACGTEFSCDAAGCDWVAGKCFNGADYTYVWTISPPPAQNVPLENRRSRDLVLPAWTLAAGVTYTFQVSVTPNLFSTVTVETVNVIVKRQGYVAAIEGGDYDYPTVGVITVDASNSYDPDVAPNDTPTQTYFWTICSTATIADKMHTLEEPQRDDEAIASLVSEGDSTLHLQRSEGGITTVGLHSFWSDTQSSSLPSNHSASKFTSQQTCQEINYVGPIFGPDVMNRGLPVLQFGAEDPDRIPEGYYEFTIHFNTEDGTDRVPASKTVAISFFSALTYSAQIRLQNRRTGKPLVGKYLQSEDFAAQVILTQPNGRGFTIPASSRVEYSWGIRYPSGGFSLANISANQVIGNTRSSYVVKKKYLQATFVVFCNVRLIQDAGTMPVSTSILVELNRPPQQRLVNGAAPDMTVVSTGRNNGALVPYQTMTVGAGEWTDTEGPVTYEFTWTTPWGEKGSLTETPIQTNSITTLAPITSQTGIITFKCAIVDAQGAASFKEVSDSISTVPLTSSGVSQSLSKAFQSPDLQQGSFTLRPGLSFNKQLNGLDAARQILSVAAVDAKNPNAINPVATTDQVLSAQSNLLLQYQAVIGTGDLPAASKKRALGGLTAAATAAFSTAGAGAGVDATDTSPAATLPLSVVLASTRTLLESSDSVEIEQIELTLAMLSAMLQYLLPPSLGTALTRVGDLKDDEIPESKYAEIAEIQDLISLCSVLTMRGRVDGEQACLEATLISTCASRDNSQDQVDTITGDNPAALSIRRGASKHTTLAISAFEGVTLPKGWGTRSIGTDSAGFFPSVDIIVTKLTPSPLYFSSLGAAPVLDIRVFKKGTLTETTVSFDEADPAFISIPAEGVTAQDQMRCLHWEPDNKGSGFWSTTGTKFVQTGPSTVLCESTHLSIWGTQRAVSIPDIPPFVDAPPPQEPSPPPSGEIYLRSIGQQLVAVCTWCILLIMWGCWVLSFLAGALFDTVKNRRKMVKNKWGWLSSTFVRSSLPTFWTLTKMHHHWIALFARDPAINTKERTIIDFALVCGWGALVAVFLQNTSLHFVPAGIVAALIILFISPLFDFFFRHTPENNTEWAATRSKKKYGAYATNEDDPESVLPEDIRGRRKHETALGTSKEHVYYNAGSVYSVVPPTLVPLGAEDKVAALMQDIKNERKPLPPVPVLAQQHPVGDVGEESMFMKDEKDANLWKKPGKQEQPLGTRPAAPSTIDDRPSGQPRKGSYVEVSNVEGSFNLAAEPLQKVAAQKSSYNIHLSDLLEAAVEELRLGRFICGVHLILEAITNADGAEAHATTVPHQIKSIDDAKVYAANRLAISESEFNAAFANDESKEPNWQDAMVLVENRQFHKAMRVFRASFLQRNPDIKDFCEDDENIKPWLYYYAEKLIKVSRHHLDLLLANPMDDDEEAPQEEDILVISAVDLREAAFEELRLQRVITGVHLLMEASHATQGAGDPDWKCNDIHAAKNLAAKQMKLDQATFDEQFKAAEQQLLWKKAVGILRQRHFQQAKHTFHEALLHLSSDLQGIVPIKNMQWWLEYYAVTLLSVDRHQLNLLMSRSESVGVARSKSQVNISGGSRVLQMKTDYTVDTNVFDDVGEAPEWKQGIMEARSGSYVKAAYIFMKAGNHIATAGGQKSKKDIGFGKQWALFYAAVAPGAKKKMTDRLFEEEYVRQESDILEKTKSRLALGQSVELDQLHISDESPAKAGSLNHSITQPQPTLSPQKPQQHQQQVQPTKSSLDRSYQDAGTLPPNWVEWMTDEGRKYYYNTDTGRSQWEHPGLIGKGVASSYAGQAGYGAGGGGQYDDPAIKKPAQIDLQFDEGHKQTTTGKPLDFSSDQRSHDVEHQPKKIYVKSKDITTNPGKGTLNDPFTELRAAFISAEDGDEIIILSGHYHPQVVVSPPRGLTVKAGEGEQVFISVDRVNHTLFFIAGADGITIQGIHFIGKKNSVGVEIVNCKGVKIQNNTFENTTTALSLDGTADGDYWDIMDNNTVLNFSPLWNYLTFQLPFLWVIAGYIICLVWCVLCSVILQFNVYKWGTFDENTMSVEEYRTAGQRANDWLGGLVIAWAVDFCLWQPFKVLVYAILYSKAAPPPNLLQ